MALSTPVNLVKIACTSQGVGPFALGAAASGFRGTEALVDGKTYSYSVQQDGNFEVGTGIYMASGQTMTRTPTVSSYGNALVPFSSGALVTFTVTAEDLAFLFTQLGIADALGNSPTVAISQRAATQGLTAKADLSPSNAFTSVTPDTVKQVYQSFITKWWNAAANRFYKTDPTGGPNTGRIDETQTVPSAWQTAQAINVIYEQWKFCQAISDTAGTTDAATKIGQQWTYLKTAFTQTQRRNGYGLIHYISDDASWWASSLMQIHDVTADATALADLVEFIANALATYHDPLQTRVDYSYTTPGGTALKSDPYGILYAASSDATGIGTYGYISSSYEVGMLLAALYVYKKDNTKTGFRQYAIDGWQRLFSLFRTPSPTSAGRTAQGIYFAGLNLDPNVANATSSVVNRSGGLPRSAQDTNQVYHGGQDAYYGQPIRRATSALDASTIGIAVLSIDLFDTIGGAAYLAEANSILAAFGLTNAFGRMRNGAPVFMICRDPFTNGFFIGRLARQLATHTSNVDTANIFRTQYRNTAKVILSQVRADGALGADWGGPEYDFGTATYSWTQESVREGGGGQAAPDQIMTWSTSMSALIGAAQIVPTTSLGSGSASRAAVDDLAGNVAMLMIAMQSKLDASQGIVNGTLRFNPTFAIRTVGGSPFFDVAPGDYFYYDPTLDKYFWYIGLAEQMHLDAFGLSVAGYVYVGGDANFFLGKFGGQSTLGLGPNTRVSYDSTNYYLNYTLNNVFSHQFGNGFIRINASQPPGSSTATGASGTIAWDTNYLYVCTATNTWKRIALTTF